MVHLHIHSYHSHVNMVSAAEEDGRWMEGRGSRDLDKRAGPQCCQNVIQAAGICVDVYTKVAGMSVTRARLHLLP